jgi:hypothetical protein
MSLSVTTVFGRRAMNRVTAADYIEWATGMLTEGHDSPNLRMLAGLDERGNVFEAEEHFSKALRELQIPEPDESGKLRAYACDLARQILDGTVAAEAGVKALYQVCLVTGYARPFMVWLYLDDALDSIKAGVYPYTYETATAANYSDIVKMEAQRFIEQMAHETAAA